MAAAAWDKPPINDEPFVKLTDPGEKVNILMVDDQPAKLMSYEVILGDLGENLIKATSANEALEHLLKKDIAIVLTDVSMPDIDGFDLAEMIRQHPRFQKTAIIFISGVHLTDIDRVKGYRQGAVDYITVPVVPELLRAKVSIFAELHRKRRQLEVLNRCLEERVAERTTELRERADLLELASEAIIVIDLQGGIRFWNSGAEELYGWGREEVAGKNIQQLLCTRAVSNVDWKAELVAHGKWEGNLVHCTRDGREVIVASRQALAIGNNGTPDTILEINRDITSHLKTEEALRKAERLAAMGRVAGIIAHEINNPLEAIINAFYLLRDHPSLDLEAREYAQLGEQELLRVAHIVRQTLGFYRESQQAIEVSVTEILDNVLELQSRYLQRNRIAVQRLYDSEVMAIGFPVELKQVFLNLIANAVQAMPDGGRLRLRVQPGSNPRSGIRGVFISISDTGSGIQPEHAKRLFEPFFSTKANKGTGLGLWISKGIIQKHEGTIDFRTVRTSRGCATCFRVFLPEHISVNGIRVSDAPANSTNEMNGDQLG
ncbi:MAG TPA: ATP-binding protein [Silvibacterium sp.]|nr:ATP-binding protein [Bryocella sp.]HTY84942.1 ATP-binding protein [Silvibacterium sp.]